MVFPIGRHVTSRKKRFRFRFFCELAPTHRVEGPHFRQLLIRKLREPSDEVHELPRFVVCSAGPEPNAGMPVKRTPISDHPEQLTVAQALRFGPVMSGGLG